MSVSFSTLYRGEKEGKRRRGEKEMTVDSVSTGDYNLDLESFDWAWGFSFLFPCVIDGKTERERACVFLRHCF